MTPAEIVSPRFRRIVENTFAADAALDPDLFVQGLTQNATFQLGAHPPVNGREAIKAMLVATFAPFSTVHHQLLAAAEAADILMYEAVVTYHFKDGRTVDASYANVLRFDDDLVRHYRVYLADADRHGDRD